MAPTCRGHLVDMEEETRRELVVLQREREMLQGKEKDNLDAIDEVSWAKDYLVLLRHGWLMNAATSSAPIS